MTGIQVDGSRWPLVVVRYPEKVSDDDLAKSLEEMRKYRERREAYALLIDSSRCSGFSARQRQMQAEYIASGIRLTRVYLKAFAFVAKSQLQRGMLTAIFWIRPPESPYRVFMSVEEAERWVMEQVPGIPARKRDELTGSS